MTEVDRISVDVFQAPAAGQTASIHLRLAPHATVEQALQALLPQPGWAAAAQAALDGAMGLSLWSRRVGLQEPLRAGDRLVLSRPLQVDPKLARRERFRGQGSKTAGLFSKRRPGAKAGY